MKEKIKKLLTERHKRHIIDAERVPSAVLIPLYKGQAHYHILFIKRAETVREHKGQISFPGGACEKEDETPLDTALRECYEEIGLHAEDIEILGELDDEVTTTSNYIVTPFVAMIPWPYQFVRNKEEVEEIIEAPLAALLEDDCLQPDTEILNGKVVASYIYHYQGRIIWGATARILNLFLDIFSQAIRDD